MNEQRPYERLLPIFGSELTVTDAPHLAAAWTFSRQRLLRIRSVLQDLPSPIACVAVSGSLCRMEAHHGSDLDLLLVIDDRDRIVSDDEATDLYRWVWQRIRQDSELSDLKAPKPGGVFSSCVFCRKLLDESVRGRVDEDLTSYGQRMQLLLDAQPLAGDDRFTHLQAQLLHWFSETRNAELFGEAGPFHWLILEVQRYWTSIRARACWIHPDEPAKALEVNIKLRSTRLLLFSAFLRTISSAQKHHSKPGELTAAVMNALHLTPLERIMSAQNPTKQTRLSLLSAYELAHRMLSQLPDSQALTPSLITALQSLHRGLLPIAEMDAV
ncbi:MAG: hypothetical protein R3C49_21345 [Planctomycetaceae bacterium]